ncbi:MAG: hypothetical protein NT165_00920 [Candidatus Falkowbacteria bacterium]|nr:hypothetical protein [Candidatus Falkowbacteria bacterium]
MNLIRVMYTLKIGDKRFLKQIFVQAVPVKGTSIKIVNSCFVVDDVEQDLDAYSDLLNFGDQSCESVRASVDRGCHSGQDCDRIIDDLLKNDWGEAKERK